MRMKTFVFSVVCGLAILAGEKTPVAATPVDLTKPFEMDKDTIALYHLDDVASGEVKTRAGGKSGKVFEADAAQREIWQGHERRRNEGLGGLRGPTQD